jgi:transposase
MYNDKRELKDGGHANLVRFCRRVNGKPRTDTVFTLDHLPQETIQYVQEYIDEHHGINKEIADLVVLKHTRKEYLDFGMPKAVLSAMDRLRFDELLDCLSDRTKRVIKGVVAAIVVDPSSKSQIVSQWEDSILSRELALTGLSVHNIYKAMDELNGFQSDIERKLIGRHLDSGDVAICDVSTTYFTGTRTQGHDREGNPVEGGSTLLARGLSKDGKRGTLQVAFSLVATRRGCPLGIKVYPGNTSDSRTFTDIIEWVLNDCGLNDIVMVGDRGMITGKHIQLLSEEERIKHITALRHGPIAKLMPEHGGSFGLLDSKNLFEFDDPRYPNERLVACLNPVRQEESLKKREALIRLTEKELDKVKARIANPRCRLRREAAIAVAASRAVGKFKMGKFFEITCRDGFLDFSLREDLLAQAKMLDGIYVIRTSVSREVMSGRECVLHYKDLGKIERSFRILKSLDIMLRPFFHRKDERIRAHMFICMLALYVSWHLRNAWAPLTYADTDLERKETRDPVATAGKSDSALRKAASGKTEDGSRVMTYRGVKNDLRRAVTTRYLPDDRGILKLPDGLFLDPVLSDRQRRIMALVDTICI